MLIAARALQVGKSGSVVGIDTSPKATKLAKSNLRTQARLNKGFADRAGPCRFQTHNVFMPASHHQVGLLCLVWHLKVHASAAWVLASCPLGGLALR